MARSASLLFDFRFGRTRPVATSRERFAIDGEIVEYVLKRSARRRGITLTVDEDGLRVGAPLRASQSRIDKVLALHSIWVARKLAEWRARRPPSFGWEPGAVLMLLGEPLTLSVADCCETTARIGASLQIAGAAGKPGVLKSETIAWLRTAAQTWFEQRSAHFSRVLRVREPTIHLSNAKTRWGTCHPDGRVYLNWRLIQTPEPLVDYVVVHELAHLLEANHSPRFWRHVAAVLPDYQERRRGLRHDAHRYLIV